MADIQERRLLSAAPSLQMRLSGILQRLGGKFSNSYLWCRTLKGIGSTASLQECVHSLIISSTHWDTVAFVLMSHLPPPCLRHNQMTSCFELVCVTMTSPALRFLHTRTNLSPFAKDFHGEGQLDEYIDYFSQVLLWQD